MTTDIAGNHRRHPHRRDRLPVVGANERQSPVVRTLLADPRSRTGVPAWPEGFGIDEFDNIVMRCIFSHVDEVVLGEKLRSHGEPKP
jgi:hypothetical protein